MTTLEDLIAQHPFWNDLRPQFFPLLNACATLEQFGPQQKIFQTGSEAACFYLIHYGHVALETPFIPGKGVVLLQTIGAGEALGWSWLFPPYVWHFSARAVEPTGAIRFDARTLRERARGDHDFGYDLAMRVGGVMLQRLQATRLQLLDSYGMRR